MATVLLVLALCAQAAPIAQPMLPSQAKSGNLPLLPYLDYYLDDSGSMDIEEVASPELASSFAAFSLEKLPRRTGVLWLRFTLSPIAAQERPPVFVLDMGPCVPGAPRLYEPVKNELSGAVEWRELGPGNRGAMLLPEAGQEPVPCYLRLEGLPGIWFSPTVRTPQDAAGNWASLARSGAVLSLGVVFFLCLLRGVSESGQWRVWTALFVFFALLQAFAGMPPQIGNPGLWGLAGILSPGIALMLLPHVGRHLLRARAVSRSIDIQLFLLSLPGAALALLPLVPGWSWLDRWLDLWPVCTLIFLPTAMGAWLMGLPGARRFLLACFLPPLFTAAGVVGLYFGMPANLLASAPLWGVAIAALLLATTRAPDYVQVEAGGGEKTPDLAADLPLPPNPGQDIITLETPLDDPNLRLIPQAAVDLPINDATTGPADKPTPQKRPAVVQSMFDEKRESALRAPLDDMMREGSALGHCALPPAARQYAGNMLAAARKMAAIISGEDLAQNGAQNGGQDRMAEPVSFNLQRLMRDAHDAVAPAAENAGIGLSWYLPPHMPQLYSGAAGALGEVLQRLLESAVRATSSGAVHLSARRVPESSDPGHILFTITDSGRGFPPVDRSSVALDRAWELVGEHNGGISMDCGAQGATIAFSLHLAPIANEVEEAGDLPQVMVLCENAEKRREIARMLAPLDIRLTESASPNDLLRRQEADPAGVLVVCGRMATPAASDMLHDFIALARKAGFGACKIMAVNSDNSQDKLLAASGFTHAIPEPLQGDELRSTVSDLVETVLAAYQPVKKPAHRIVEEPQSGQDEAKTDPQAHDFGSAPASEAAFAKAAGPEIAAAEIVEEAPSAHEAGENLPGAVKTENVDFGNDREAEEARAPLSELFGPDGEDQDVFDDLADQGAKIADLSHPQTDDGSRYQKPFGEEEPVDFKTGRDAAIPVAGPSEGHKEATLPDDLDEIPDSAMPADYEAERAEDLPDSSGVNGIPESAMPAGSENREKPILPNDPDETDEPDEIDQIPAAGSVPGTESGNNLRSDLTPDLAEKLERDLADVLEPEVLEDRRVDLGDYSEIERESGTRLQAMAKMAEDLRAAGFGADEEDSRPAGKQDAQAGMAENAQAGMAGDTQVKMAENAQAEMAGEAQVKMAESGQGSATENDAMKADEISGQKMRAEDLATGLAAQDEQTREATQGDQAGQNGRPDQAGHIELASHADHHGHEAQKNQAGQTEQIMQDAQLVYAEQTEQIPHDIQLGHEGHADQADRTGRTGVADHQRKQTAAPRDRELDVDQEISAEADRIVETIFAPQDEAVDISATKTLVTPEATRTTIEHAGVTVENPAQSAIDHGPVMAEKPEPAQIDHAYRPAATSEPTQIDHSSRPAATPGAPGSSDTQAGRSVYDRDTLWDDVEWVGEPMPVGATVRDNSQTREKSAFARLAETQDHGHQTASPKIDNQPVTANHDHPGDQRIYAPKTYDQTSQRGRMPSDAVEWVGEPTPIIRKKPETAARPSVNADRSFKNGAKQATAPAAHNPLPENMTGPQTQPGGANASPQTKPGPAAGEKAAPRTQPSQMAGEKAGPQTQPDSQIGEQAPQQSGRQKSKNGKKPQETNSLISDFVNKTISQVSSTIERMTRSRKDAKAENAAPQTRKSADQAQAAPDQHKAAPEIAMPAAPEKARGSAEDHAAPKSNQSGWNATQMHNAPQAGAPYFGTNAAQPGTNAPKAGSPQSGTNASRFETNEPQTGAPQAGLNAPQKAAPFRFSSTNAQPHESGSGKSAQPGDAGAQEADPAIRVLVGKLDRAIEDAKKCFASRNCQAVADCAAKIADESGQFGLRVLSRMAKCVERAGRAGDMAALNDLLPELVAAVERNRITLTQIK